MKYALTLTIVIFGIRCLRADPTDSVKVVKQTKTYVPDYVGVQFAGNIGFISAGAGYHSTRENYQVGLYYGYVPASVATRRIHMVSMKNVFHITRFPMKNYRSIAPYLGLGITLEVGGISFIKLPSYYPRKYYFPKAVHLIGYGGVKFQHPFSDQRGPWKGMELYAEAGAVDQFIWYKALSEHVKFRDIISLALGANFLLKN